MKRPKNIGEVLKNNPWIKKEDLNMRADGRIEWQCEHGVGHTIFSKENHYLHGCDGCCNKIK